MENDFLIRELHSGEIPEAVRLRIECEDTDFPGIVQPGTFQYDEELEEITSWIECSPGDDLRRLFGTFKEGNLIGFIGLSYAEKSDSDNGVEINYLFVRKEQRGRGIGRILIKQGIDFFVNQGVKDVIVYCYRDSDANGFYRKLGARVLREETQYPNDKPVKVDVFIWNVKP